MRGCDFEGCGRPHSARGLCQTHYRQYQRGKPLTPVPETQVRPCGFAGCDRPLKAKGLCNGHRLQQVRGQELRPLGQGKRGTIPAEVPEVGPVPGAPAPVWGSLWPELEQAHAPKARQKGAEGVTAQTLLYSSCLPDPVAGAAALRLLARHQASDLAEVLGLTTLDEEITHAA